MMKFWGVYNLWASQKIFDSTCFKLYFSEFYCRSAVYTQELMFLFTLKLLVVFFSALVGGIDSLMNHFVGDKLVSSTLGKFSCALTELQTYLSVSEICLN